MSLSRTLPALCVALALGLPGCGKDGAAGESPEPAGDAGADASSPEGMPDDADGEDSPAQTWDGFSFPEEPSAEVASRFFAELEGTWLLGSNMGTTDQGIEWTAIQFRGQGERGGSMAWYTSSTDSSSFSTCAYRVDEPIATLTRSEKLADEIILVDFRFVDGRFQQVLLQRRGADLFGLVVDRKPVDDAPTSIQDYLDDLGGSIGNQLMQRVTSRDCPD